MWSEKYEKLSTYEKGEFRRIANYLLSHTYIVRHKYDPVKEMTLPNEDYSFLMRVYPLIQEYFEVTGWILQKDDTYGIISLINQFDHNRYRLDRFTTLFLYVCRLIYEEKREEENNYHMVKTDTFTVVEKMKSLGLLNKGKSTKEERKNAQTVLAHYNIIQKLDTTSWTGEGNEILILPSILSVINNQSINAMIEQIDDMKTTEEQIEGNENENP